jgi:type II secretory pathway pseudopilin PulG
MLRARSQPGCGGFSLLELLVVGGILVLLAGLLLPVLSRAKHSSRRVTCINNIRQVNLATRLYADEHGDRGTLPANSGRTTGSLGCHIKGVVKSYAGYHGQPSASETLFKCPEDRFYYNGKYFNRGLCEEAVNEYSSYGMQVGNMLGTNKDTGAPFIGIAGKKLSAFCSPAKVVVIAEEAAFVPFSWHNPQKYVTDYRFKDSMNMLSFVDGHVSLSKIYYAGGLEAWHYNPPPEYDYLWSE